MKFYQKALLVPLAATALFAGRPDAANDIAYANEPTPTPVRYEQAPGAFQESGRELDVEMDGKWYRYRLLRPAFPVDGMYVLQADSNWYRNSPPDMCRLLLVRPTENPGAYDLLDSRVYMDTNYSSSAPEIVHIRGDQHEVRITIHRTDPDEFKNDLRDLYHQLLALPERQELILFPERNQGKVRDLGTNVHNNPRRKR